MLKWVSLSVALLISFIGYSQGLSSAGLNFIKLDQEDEFIVSPHAKWEKNNHAWSIGPSILYSFGDQLEEREKLKFTGVAASYEHYLHGSEEKWNLFHSFDFVIQRIKDTQESQYFEPESNTLVPNKIEQIDNSLFLSANAGVLLNLSQKLALTQSIGIGAHAVFRKTESTIDSFNDTFLDQKWLLKTGLNYKIGN